MSTTTIIIGIVLGTLLGAVIIALRNRQQDVFAILFVAGIAALAIAVNINGITQFWEQRSDAAAVAQSQPQTNVATPTAAPPIPPHNLPSPPPMMRGATGSAAPQAVQNPYMRRS